MPNTPIQAWNKDSSSEAMNYILEVLTPVINRLEDKKVDRKDIQGIVDAINRLVATKADRSDAADFKSLANLVAAHRDNCLQYDLVRAVNVCAAKFEKLSDAIKALSDKLDAEDVTSLDKDYRSLVDTKLE